MICKIGNHFQDPSDVHLGNHFSSKQKSDNNIARKCKILQWRKLFECFWCVHGNGHETHQSTEPH